MENFVELVSLYKQVGGSPGSDGWSDEVRDAVSGRFDRVVSVWLDEPLSALGSGEPPQSGCSERRRSGRSVIVHDRGRHGSTSSRIQIRTPAGIMLERFGSAAP
jgi:hypothetical protein